MSRTLKEGDEIIQKIKSNLSWETVQTEGPVKSVTNLRSDSHITVSLIQCDLYRPTRAHFIRCIVWCTDQEGIDSLNPDLIDVFLLGITADLSSTRIGLSLAPKEGNTDTTYEGDSERCSLRSFKSELVPNTSYILDDFAREDIAEQVVYINLKAVDKTEVDRLCNRVTTYRERGYTPLIDTFVFISPEEFYSMRMMIGYSSFLKWSFEEAKPEDCEMFL